MTKLNCWEMEKCERQPGGSKTKELGICPASSDTASEGVNGGVNGGRICWAIAGTMCGGKIQGSHADKQSSCMFCEFYKHVKAEEGKSFEIMRRTQVYKRASR